MFEGTDDARQVLTDAENELRNWQPNLEPIHSYAENLGRGAMPEGQAVDNGTSVDGSEVSHAARAAQDQGAYVEVTSPGGRGNEEERPDAPVVEQERVL